jgi:hypothetical protein
MKLISVFAALSLLLVSCVPINPETLRANPDRSQTFQTATDYAVAYERISAGFLSCLTGSDFRKTFAIKPRIDKGSRTASIYFVHHGMWTDYWALVEIIGRSSGADIEVKTSSFSAIEYFGETSKRWADGSRHCPEQSHLAKQFPLAE